MCGGTRGRLRPAVLSEDAGVGVLSATLTGMGRPKQTQADAKQSRIRPDQSARHLLTILRQTRGERKLGHGDHYYSHIQSFAVELEPENGRRAPTVRVVCLCTGSGSAHY